MNNYQISQFQAASEILELYGLPLPYSVSEKIRVIEASKRLAAARIESTVGNYWIAIREVINQIKADRLRQRNSLQTNSQAICVIDWRDDSEQLLWV